MKKILFTALLSLCAGMSATAQITTGTPSAKHFKTGNRAQSGDFGIYLGMSSNMFKNLTDKDIKFENPMPLINLKYMITDNWEARVGLEFSKTRETVKGDQFMDETDNNGEPVGTEAKYKIVEADNRITPGIAYHFSKHNIIDVYAGAEGLLGWKRNSNYVTIDNDENSTRKASCQFGAGAFIGLQAYIGNLPLAIGVEYGLSTLWESRLRYKQTSTDGEGNEQTSYTTNAELLPMLGAAGQLPESAFENMKATRGTIGNKFAITLTYFFK
ncbi:MAG: outer membrane beta-barrel protein [Clostridium sp.]|nr:outer membrane beta-barrel protein [Clostridium sp.]